MQGNVVDRILGIAAEAGLVDDTARKNWAVEDPERDNLMVDNREAHQVAHLEREDRLMEPEVHTAEVLAELRTMVASADTVEVLQELRTEPADSVAEDNVLGLVQNRVPMVAVLVEDALTEELRKLVVAVARDLQEECC